jgi:hypothetical protein
MSEIFIIILLILGGELLGHLVFWFLSRWNMNRERTGLTFKSIFKGLIERGFITFTLASGFPQALTFFAALKIATRIKDDDKISNEFYLLGNIFSVTLAIIYSMLINNFF